MARQVVVEIVGDDRKFKGSLDGAGTSATKFGAIVGVVSGVVASATTKAIDFVLDTGAELIALGPKMEAMDAKAKTVFGDSLGSVQKWADANAAAMGLTSRSAVGLATNMADLLIPMGFTRDAAAEMSTGIVGLSGALAEWTGGTKSAEEVAVTLQKALLGERDGLKELGISLTDADVKAQLVKDGTDKLTGAALEQAKALATQKLILAKTTDAQDAYAKGTAVGIRKQHEMDAQLNSVKETLAKNLYPILQAVTGFIAENLPKAIKFLGEAWTNLKPIILPIIAILADVGKVVVPLIGTAIGLVAKAFGTAWSVISNVVGKIAGTFSGIIRGIKGFVNTLIAGWNSIKFTMPTVDLGPLGKVGGFTIGTPNIPYLHAGGIVPGRPGSDVLTILQAGERVIPRKDVGGSGGGGITIVIQGNVYGGPAGLDQLSRDIASRLRTRLAVT